MKNLFYKNLFNVYMRVIQDLYNNYTKPKTIPLPENPPYKLIKDMNITDNIIHAILVNLDKDKFVSHLDNFSHYNFKRMIIQLLSGTFYTFKDTYAFKNEADFISIMDSVKFKQYIKCNPIYKNSDILESVVTLETLINELGIDIILIKKYNNKTSDYYIDCGYLNRFEFKPDCDSANIRGKFLL